MSGLPYKVQIIPDDERITVDKINSFEMASLIAHRISQIGKDATVYLPDEYRYVNTEQLNPRAKKNIPPENVIKNGNGTFVKLVSTVDIVSAELNTGNNPYCILRIISIDHQRRIIHAEIVDPNNSPKEVLEYYSNYSV